MAYWLVKSEPEDWSWQDQSSVDKEPWTGVRNYQAQKHMAAMQVGDKVFFYHSGKAREIVGICTVATASYPDPDDPKGRFILVDLKAEKALSIPVTLRQIKEDESLSHLALVRQSRLSVMPIDDKAWETILAKSAG
ncbi:ubiquinol-cytochrome c reductase [Kordiimonas sediminis]|uniref:Ubiquinol-cytochrome c reductase n=1 Tax=Kordiimonas sediminis TaxID=1735581 RepID=A0A919AKH7_9PROT|nr:EVE domain-containing protein [Kordiimonas sediminis]GHF13090.1 ubiquinol-cytochrome c reductase [Kordiimonas sediminis]